MQRRSCVLSFKVNRFAEPPRIISLSRITRSDGFQRSVAPEQSAECQLINFSLPSRLSAAEFEIHPARVYVRVERKGKKITAYVIPPHASK